jgi:hypothetical protein
MDKIRSESETLTLDELSKEIQNTELKLKNLRDEYISRSGVLPPRSFGDKNWRWTIYMTLGIAYITFITYFLGIKQSGRGEGFWIPDFLPLLIAKPPMWLFLTLAVFGVGMSVYTFTVPDNYKKLIPTVIWLYAVYMNGLVCEMLGLSTPIALTIGLVIVAISFTLMIYLSVRKIQKKRQEKKKTHESTVTKRGLWFKKNWFVYTLLFLILSTYVFSVVIPLVGLILGMITWYVIPLLFFIVNATPFQKLSQKKKLLVIIISIVGIGLISVFLTLAMPILR